MTPSLVDHSEVLIIAIGALNTDIIALGISKFPKPGEHAHGKELRIGAGGKSANVAAMAAHIVGRKRVAMVGRTSKDRFGLWKMPVEALQRAGVNTDFVVVDDFLKSKKYPGMALIPVDEQGRNQIFSVPGANSDFSPQDIDRAMALFAAAGSRRGILILSLECRFDTAASAIKKAKEVGLKVILDPGGIRLGIEISTLLDGLFLIKPNEYETKIITGIEVVDEETASQAAGKLAAMGVKNVLITVGQDGGYLFDGKHIRHFPVPTVDSGETKDETGCGDQTIATLCAFLQEGKSLTAATRLAIAAGTLQFQRAGVQPLSRQEILDAAAER